MRVALCVLLSASISGCTTLNNEVHEVTCTGSYNSVINLHQKFEIIKVKQVRIDKNGTTWIRPVNTLNTRFLGGPWQRPALLKDYRCEGEDYGLRSTTI
jgi:hypothetical protein